MTAAPRPGGAADASLGWWGAGRRPVHRRGDHRPRQPAGQGHLASGHEPAPPRRPARGTKPWPAASLAEIVRIYGLRHWAGQPPSRSRTNSAWPTSRSVPTSPSAATRRWSTARSPSAGPPRHPHRGRHRTSFQRGGGPPQPWQPQTHPAVPPVPNWPRRPQLADPRDHAHALVARMVQGAPPPDLQHLLDSVTSGHGLFLYLPP